MLCSRHRTSRRLLCRFLYGLRSDHLLTSGRSSAYLRFQIQGVYAACRSTALLMLIVVSSVAGASAQTTEDTATVSGCVTDTAGYPLPDVPVDLSGNGKHRIVRTNAAGCYEVAGLPRGSYAVFVTLQGFLSNTHDPLNLESGQSENVSFQMRVAPICECITVPRTLSGLWNEADVVVRLRITGHKPGPTWSSQHIARLLTIWKRDPTLGAPSATVVFSQFRRVGEIEPFAIGQDFVMFLDRALTEGAFNLVSGGDGDGTNAALAIEDGRIRSAPIAHYVGMDVSQLVAELEGLSRP